MRKSRCFQSLLTIALLLGPACLALGEDPYGTKSFRSRNFGVQVGISGYGSAGIKVSGTNAAFGFAAESLLPDEPPYEGSDPWTSIVFNSVTLKFGEGGSGLEQTWYAFPWNHGIRWSTTHFDNGALTISCTLSVTFSRPGESLTVPVTADVSVDVYNKGLILGTKEWWGLTILEEQMIQPPAYHWVVREDKPPAIIAAATLPFAKSGMESMKHQPVEPSLEQAQNLRQTDLEDLFKRNTAFFTVTHGQTNPGGIRASSEDFMPWQGTSNPTSVAAMCLNDRTVPPYNLVVLFCCNGVTNGDWSATAAAFGITYIPNPYSYSPDQCVLAFGAPIATCMDHNNTAIPNWTEKFYAYLKAGFTVKQAVWKVHFEDYIYIHSAPNCGVIDPVPVGDPKTKLYGVYLTPEGEAPCFIVTS